MAIATTIWYRITPSHNYNNLVSKYILSNIFHKADTNPPFSFKPHNI